jgi:hypothetical protein
MMRPNLTAEMVQTQIDNRLEEAERFRRGHELRQAKAHSESYDSVTVRRSYPDDADTLRELAERDGRRIPAAPMLIAEARGRVLAARSLEDGSSISDPFEPTGHLIELLALRSAHLRDALGECSRPRFARLRRFIPQLH